MLLSDALRITSGVKSGNILCGGVSAVAGGLDFSSGVISLNLAIIRVSSSTPHEPIANRITEIIMPVLFAFKREHDHLQVVLPTARGHSRLCCFVVFPVCAASSVGRNQEHLVS